MFKLSVVTPIAVYFEGEVSSIVAPGSDGYLGILSNHAPLITSLEPGLLTIKDEKQGETEFAIGGGFLEVSNNKATILAESIEPLTEIDLARAEAACKRCEKRIAGLMTNEDVDLDRSRHAMAKALNRIALVRRAGRLGGSRRDS